MGSAESAEVAGREAQLNGGEGIAVDVWREEDANAEVFVGRAGNAMQATGRGGADYAPRPCDLPGREENHARRTARE